MSGLHPAVRPPVPPAPDSKPGLRKPALAERSPRLLAAGVVAANVLDAWMRRNGHSNAELAEQWGVTEKTVRELRSREKRLGVDHVLALPTRALCHWLIDQLPFTAYQELLRALVDLRSYHAALSVEPQPPRLASAKPVKKVSRTTRPEVDLTGE